MYQSINDAKHSCPGLAKGDTEIWYVKDDLFRDFILGFDYLKNIGKLPDPSNLGATHVKLGSVLTDSLEEIYSCMQGEMWSPRGEANALIKRLGISHTSMSVGDIVVVDGVACICDIVSFKRLG